MRFKWKKTALEDNEVGLEYHKITYNLEVLFYEFLPSIFIEIDEIMQYISFPENVRVFR